MSVLRDMVASFATGFISAVNNHQALANGFQEHARIERLCREMSWTIDERLGDVIVLHFKCPLAGIRKVYISAGDALLVQFTVYSYALLRASDVPEQVISHLLLRNKDVPIGAWYVNPPDQDGQVLFTLRYRAIGSGLDTQLFTCICEEMLRETSEFDNKMCGAGLL